MTEEIKNFEIGNFKASLLHVDTFRLDGGAMFGIVPKPIWNKNYEADNQNRINLFGSLLHVNADGTNIIVETGIGRKLSPKEEKIYNIKNARTIPEALLALNLKLNDIDYVILTHLHLDHAGGATEISDESPEPTFKNAQYIVQKDEFETATNPTERTKGSYKKKDFLPLKKAGNLNLVEDEHKITNGVKVVKTGGHTIGHQIAYFEDSGETLLHIGDLVPTSQHIPLPYIMAYDTHPLTTLEWRKKLYREIVEKNMKVVFPHDIKQKVATPSDFAPQLENTQN